jgi:putative transposase
MARAVAVGIPHHITQRGNYRQVIFERDDDYRKYLEWLKYYSEKCLLKIWAYCLMSNHVHFVAVPGSEESMARTFNTLHMRYAQYANTKQGEKGHLWQGRYYSSALDEKQVYAAVRYVENNPVSARVVKKAENYKWPSAKSHVKKMGDEILATDCYLVKEIKDWAAFLEEKDDAGTTQAVRENTKAGRPCGDEKFIIIEQAVGRKLVALPRGRPKKGE